MVPEPGGGVRSVGAARPETWPTTMSRGSDQKSGTALAFWASRGMLYVAAFVLLVSFFAPLWHYNFTAPLYPEYPEGLPMTIYIDHLGGRIDLVNELNHYIGMRKIVESDFAALSLMPWLVALLCASGFVVATWSRERLWPLVAWLSVFAVTGLALLGDFYLWLYTYGHDLNPHAAIRIAPFTPHLLGSYVVVMVFHVMTWPGLGAIAMMASFGLGALALVAKLLSQRASVGAQRMFGQPSVYTVDAGSPRRAAPSLGKEEIRTS